MIGALEQRKPALPYSSDMYLSGRAILPPWFRQKQSVWYPYVFQSTPSQSSLLSTVTLDSDTFFLWEGINIISNPSLDPSTSLNIQFSDTSKGQPSSTGNLVLRNISGRGDNTKYFTSPTLLRPATAITFNVNNASTQPIYGTILGRKVKGLTEQEARFLLRRMFFQYDVFFGAVAASGFSQYQVQTYADSDFYLWRMWCSQGLEYVNSQLKAGVSPSDLLINLRDSTTNANLFNQACALRLVSGSIMPILDTNASPQKVTLGGGFELSIPLKIKRNATVTLEVQNLNATNAMSTPFNFTLEGCRAFD